MLIQKSIPSESPRVSEQFKEQKKLTFEEENAVRYVGGYVIRQLCWQRRANTNHYRGFQIVLCYWNVCKETLVHWKSWNIGGELRNGMLKDEDVFFYWCRASQIEGDDAAYKSLAMIVDLWITIRANSFSKNILEMCK